MTARESKENPSRQESSGKRCKPTEWKLISVTRVLGHWAKDVTLHISEAKRVTFDEGIWKVNWVQK